MKPLAPAFLSLALISASSAALAAPKVVASIKPVHSLVEAVMGDKGKAALIVTGASSPHDYAMKPDTARALSEAELVFWIGPDLEGFLEKSLETISAKATSVELGEAKGVSHHPFRELAELGKDDHAEHKHDEHEQEHDDHAKKDDHDHSGNDPHVWLDPENAIAMTGAIAAALSRADPDNAGTYKANAEKVQAELSTLQKTITADMSPLKKRFIVFHDAYQYFEKRFGLSASGALSIRPETPPGAKHLREVAHQIKHDKISCVFSEPQFPAKLIEVVTAGTKARIAQLDPLGAKLEPGPALYPQLLKNMAAAMGKCLGENPS